MKYYKVFFWLNGEFKFEIVEVNFNETEAQANFSVREYHKAKGLHSRISHASFYCTDFREAINDKLQQKENER